MNFRIESTNFQPKHGGGGGTFYMGRQDQPDEERDEREEDDEEEDASLAGDRVDLQPGVSSLLTLRSSAATAREWEAISSELKNNLRYLTLAVSHLERDYARRQHAEIGSLVIEE